MNETPGTNDNNADVSKKDMTLRGAAAQDLPDNDHDLERMQEEEVVLDLPEVSDIPGQEHIHVAPFGEMSDVTVSSDDEEGDELFTDDGEDETAIVMGTEADITPGEKATLEKTDTDMPGGDDDRLRSAALDEVDQEGEMINEGSLATNVSGDDLDMPGDESNTDEQADSQGQGDEENKVYSLGSESNDNVTEGTP